MKTIFFLLSTGAGVRRIVRSSVLCLFLTFGTLPSLQSAPPSWVPAGPRDVTLMTRNVYVGSGFGGILALDPSDPMYLPKLVQAVTEVYYAVLVQNAFQIRAEALAAQIAAAGPDLVGLQEMATVRLQSPGDLVTGGGRPATDVVVDFTDVLLSALAARGASYAVVASVTNWDVELPVMNLRTGGVDDARLTDHDVILARTDLPPGHLIVSHPQSGNFRNALVFPAIGLVLSRGWCAVDVTVRGRSFRFVNAHVEEETSPVLQWAQARELLEGPVNVPGPVVLAGDFNSDANGQSGTVTYDGLLAAGFADVWSAVHPGDPGLTWGHDAWLADPTTPFIWRLDLILTRNGGFLPVDAAVLDAATGRSEPPFWGSDHAAVVARLRLP